MKKKKARDNHEGNFRQLSFFDLLEIDAEKPIEEIVERTEQPTIFDFKDESEIGNNTRLVRTGSESALQSSDKGIDNGDADRETIVYGTNEPSEETLGYGEGIDNGVVDESSNHEPIILQRVHLEVDSDEHLNVAEKIKRNIRAIEVLNQVNYENRQAFDEEQEILSSFSGWGGCPQLFNEKDDTYAKERSMLKNLLSIDEYQNAKASTLTSFYTPLSIIQYMYQIIDRLGFEHGNILETSMGTGNFIGLMPESMFQNSMICGIELDDVSAAIATQLYPSVDVQNIGFENCPYPNEQFDLAISNVPFGTYQVHDREFNQYHFHIHNYFFAKALNKVRNGGLIAFITTSETMDGNNGVMEYINERADFLGAIRLPNNIFMKNGANTQVTSDIIFLRRNDDKVVDYEQDIVQKVPFTEHRKVNRYFVEHPEMVFGTMKERTNQFGGYEITVIQDGMEISEHFHQVLDTFPSIYQEKEEVKLDGIYHAIDIEHSKYPCDTFFVENEKLYYRDEDVYYLVQTTDEIKNKEIREGHISFKNKTEIRKVQGMIRIADAAMRVINAQSKNVEENIYLTERETLNKVYDEFVKEFGALHKRTNLPLISDDPRNYLLDSLEDYDIQTKEVKKSQLFSERTVRVKKEIKEVDNAYDGLLLSLDNKGKIDLGYISTLYGKTIEETKTELIEKQYVYVEPQTKELVLANDYLSGNVRKKLQIAQQYGYDLNIDALKKVMPEKIAAQDIVVQLGATWVPSKYVREFMLQLFEIEGWAAERMEISYDSIAGIWVMETPYPSGVVQNVWGVEKSEGLNGKRQPDYTGYDLVENVLNSKIPNIRNYWDEWNEEKQKYIVRSETNAERTTQAQELVERLNEAWEEWIFEDYERREDLVNIYNEKFNSIRLPVYDGSFLSFPEMNASIQLERYQKNAIARIMNKNTNTLLWQKVGAGKTFEMVAGGMEMKRLGIRNKILYVVPNHLLMQWQKEFLLLYPNAHILVATKKDFAKDKRQSFVNKIVTGNYDAIIMAHSSFGMISVGKSKQIEFEERELSEITSAIEELENNRNQSASTQRIKILERTKKSIEKRIRALTDSIRDSNLIPFEELGIDYLFVDESHEFKNLYMYTAMQNVVGLQTASSQKAQDMYMKCRIIQEDGGNVCFATGTPVTNTMAELYTVQRFLQLEVLHEMGIYCFDAWQKAFGKVVHSFEISIDGTQFVMRSRFAKFFNVQELMTVFRQVAEIQTEKMLREELENSKTGRRLALPPKHIGNKPQIISIEPSVELEEYIGEIVLRSENIHNGSVDPREDNMLKVTSDSKKASIDMRLIDPSYPEDENGKLWTIARKVYEVYNEYAEFKATQVIFCDSSTPSNKTIPMKYENGEYVEDLDAFHNVYDEIRKKLVLLGIPKDEIAFIHDHDTEAKKIKLFQKMNDGEMRILFGSTPKLGAGTNIQKRLIAVHHVDVPWKASDIEQQNGRAFRQGNMFDEIYEFRYVTKKSFDAYSWQMVETKSTYMEQLLEGADGMREFEENQQASFSFAEVKAIASGNPIIKEKFEVDNEVKRLEGLKKHYRKQKLSAQEQVIKLPNEITELKNWSKILKAETQYFEPFIYQESEIEANFIFRDVNQRTYKNMKEAWEVVKERYKQFRNGVEGKVGSYLGAELFVNNDNGIYTLKIQTPTPRMLQIDTANEIGRVNFVRILKRISEIKENSERIERKVEIKEKNLITFQEVLTKDFVHEEELQKMRIRQKEINAILETDTKEPSNELTEIEEIEMEM
ncbi:DEAD/DEAH box helicase family protein [[Clostridium] innocuum]|nr:DEAD/DEAH box helicase family protein [[Clostridium] innocuum]